MTDPWFTFPAIDPIAFSLGPLVIRWYALAYIAGLMGGWQILRRIAKSDTYPITPEQIDQLLNYVLLGVVVGGRLGYVLFYNPSLYLSDPLAALKIWQGGMSFHGGFLGVVAAIYLFARKYKLSHILLGDMAALVAPLGLFFGRIANFINGELYGRITDHPIGIVFPHAGTAPRHLSQLYEAGLEGIILGLILAVMWRMGFANRMPMSLMAVFFAGYGAARFIAEFFREPDAHIGIYELGAIGLSQGQLLSLPMIVAGLYLLYLSTRQQSR